MLTRSVQKFEVNNSEASRLADHGKSLLLTTGSFTIVASSFTLHQCSFQSVGPANSTDKLRKAAPILSLLPCLTISQ